MKKRIYTTILIIIMIFTMVACGSKSADGTWYSVTDSTMYQFESGKVTCAGQVVGQYEDNGDSIVLSMIDGTNSLKLYITTLNEIEILADTESGEGNIYFCRGVDNVEKIVEYSAIYQMEEYVKENLYGNWKYYDEYGLSIIDGFNFVDNNLIQEVNKYSGTTWDWNCSGMDLRYGYEEYLDENVVFIDFHMNKIESDETGPYDITLVKYSDNPAIMRMYATDPETHEINPDAAALANSDSLMHLIYKEP